MCCDINTCESSFSETSTDARIVVATRGAHDFCLQRHGPQVLTVGTSGRPDACMRWSHAQGCCCQDNPRGRRYREPRRGCIWPSRCTLGARPPSCRPLPDQDIQRRAQVPPILQPAANGKYSGGGICHTCKQRKRHQSRRPCRNSCGRGREA